MWRDPKGSTAFGSELLLLDDLPNPWVVSDPHAIGRVMTDRGVYKANDIVRVSGYVREQEGSRLVAPASSTSCSLHVRWSRGSSPTEISLQLDGPTARQLDDGTPTFASLTSSSTPHLPPPIISPAPRQWDRREHLGSFSAELTVPPSADYTTHALSLSCVSRSSLNSGQRTLHTVTVAVSDPRPPTVTLEASFTSSPLLRPGGHVELKVIAASMTGLPVSRAAVVLRWSLHRSAARRGAVHPGVGGGEGAAEDENGEETILTDESGIGLVEWRPANLSAPESIGDLISLALEWIGPTR